MKTSDVISTLALILSCLSFAATFYYHYKDASERETMTQPFVEFGSSSIPDISLYFVNSGTSPAIIVAEWSNYAYQCHKIDENSTAEERSEFITKQLAWLDDVVRFRLDKISPRIFFRSSHSTRFPGSSIGVGEQVKFYGIETLGKSLNYDEKNQVVKELDPNELIIETCSFGRSHCRLTNRVDWIVDGKTSSCPSRQEIVDVEGQSYLAR